MNRPESKELLYYILQRAALLSCIMFAQTDILTASLLEPLSCLQPAASSAVMCNQKSASLLLEPKIELPHIVKLSSPSICPIQDESLLQPFDQS